MAYTASYALDLGTVGLTLKWALTSAGTIHATLRDQTSTFYADAAGGYECVATTIPDSFRGMIVFYTGTIGAGTDFSGVVVYSYGSINAEEFENTDVKTSSRMATYTQPTGFLTATFPSGTIANTTNITGGTITTVTNLTNLPAITAGWLTATGIASDAITAAKIADGAIDTATFASGCTIPRVTLADTVTTVTGLTASNLDATISSRLASASYTAPPSAATISTQVNSDITSAHGSGSYITATGFATSAQAVKLLAACYDSATLSVSTLTLSNGATMVVSSSGRVTTG